MLTKSTTLLRSPLAAVLLVFVLAATAFAVLKAESAPHYRVSRESAIRIARADPRVAPVLTHRGYTSVRVDPLDQSEQRVSFFDGARLVVHAAVGSGRRVTHVAVRTPGSPMWGSRIANASAVLIAMALLFVLAVATVPLLSLENLDVLAFASFTLPVWLINEGLIQASVIAAYPPLAYLMVRMLAFGLRGGGRASREPLLSHVASRLAPAERRRVLRAVLAGTAAMITLVTVTSTGANDVAFAALAGATDLVHGVVPYGHIPGFVLHGDTYPLLTYALYVPAAAVMPVTDLFSDPQGALIVTAIATLLTAWGLHRLAGPRAALGWLAFPPVLLSASTGSNDVVLAACLVAVLATAAHRARSALLLGVAAWVKVIPLLALPVWLARMNRRGVGQTLAGLAALSAILGGWIVALGGVTAIGSMLHALSFQLDRGSLSSLWVGLGAGDLQPVAEAAVLAAVAAATAAVQRDRELRTDLPRLAALLTGIVLVAQFAASYWTWAYLPWAIAPAIVVLTGRTRASSPGRPSPCR